MVCAPEGFQQNGQPTTVGLCLPRGLLDRPEANPDGDGLPWQLRDPKLSLLHGHLHGTTDSAGLRSSPANQGPEKPSNPSCSTMKRLVWTDTHTHTHLGRKRQDLPYTTVMHFAPYARV